MKKMEKFKNLINEKLIKQLSTKDISLDFFYGKMGICIYLFEYGKLFNENKFLQLGESLIDDIYEQIQKNKLSDFNLNYDLVGASLGFDYLIKQKYVKGNINDILEHIDHIIFMQFLYGQGVKKKSLKESFFLLYYFIIRLESQKKRSDNEFIFQELIIEELNSLYLNNLSVLFEEPSKYTIYYWTPIFLYMLERIYRQGFYNERIINVLREITPKILSKFPVLHSNRLFLAWGMSNVKNIIINSQIWNEHLGLITEHINFEKIVFQELKDKDIYLTNGITSIYLLFSDIIKKAGNVVGPVDYDIFNKKIEQSEVWNEILSSSEYFKEHMGLIDGICGVILVNQIMNKKNI
jgi:hypothetical protein